jgi:hypothetical protein
MHIKSTTASSNVMPPSAIIGPHHRPINQNKNGMVQETEANEQHMQFN